MIWEEGISSLILEVVCSVDLYKSVYPTSTYQSPAIRKRLNRHCLILGKIFCPPTILILFSKVSEYNLTLSAVDSAVFDRLPGFIWHIAHYRLSKISLDIKIDILRFVICIATFEVITLAIFTIITG